MKKEQRPAPPLGADGTPYEARDDEGYDSLYYRLAAHESVMIARGGFTESEAFETLCIYSPAQCDRIATWLRTELSMLRELEKKVGPQLGQITVFPNWQLPTWQCQLWK